MTLKKGEGDNWLVGGALICILLYFWLTYSKKRGVAAAGGGSSAPVRAAGPYGSQDAGLLQQMLQALQRMTQSGAGKSSQGLPSAPAGSANNPYGKNLTPFFGETIGQALTLGNTNIDQNVLAQIFNAQHGFYADQTVAQQGQGWLDSNQWNLADLFAQREPQLDYQATQQFDFGNWGTPAYSSGYDYASTVYSDYGSPSISMDTGQDYSNYDWSGGAGGWDVPAGDGGSLYSGGFGFNGGNDNFYVPQPNSGM